MLDGSVEGKVRIGDDVETIASGGFELVWAGESDPSALHLGQAAEFGDAAKGEGEGGGLCGERLRGS